MRKILLLTGMVIVFSKSLEAWHSWGHLLVAKIAYTQLSDPVRAAVDELIINFDSTDLATSTFVTASCWPDDIKNERGLHMFDGWHFTINVHDTDGVLSEAEKDALEAPKLTDAIGIINQSIHVLNNPKSGTWEKGFALRFLIHCIGDVHQPMHCVTHYSTKFPKGDRGGNSYLLEVKEKSLHALWDSMLGIGDYNPVRPLSTNDIKRLDAEARDLMELYQRSQLSELSDTTPRQWATESLSVAKEYAYAIQVGQAPSDEYLERGREVCKKRIALAGYRLADVLNSVFKH